MNRRTTVTFPCPPNFWKQVDARAADTGFTLNRKDKEQRTYRKGNRLLMAPAWVTLRRDGKQAMLEAWVVADMFLILSALAGKKPETGIKSGGLTAMLPRRRAAKRSTVYFDASIKSRSPEPSLSTLMALEPG
ncbi:MAG: hypothetical protein R6V33_02865 [Pelovirga sp.]